MLYIRMFVSMGILLFSSRIVLQQLGVDDYGIYNVIAGMVALVSFLNASMSGATARFLTFEQENENPQVLKTTFGNSLLIHLLIGLMVIVALETVGVWFLENHLNLPSGSLSDSYVVFQFAVATTFLTIIKVPYSATIIAREQMNTYAYIEITNSVFTLLAAVFLIFASGNKLILYSALIFGFGFATLLVYFIYCTKNFPECRPRYHFNRSQLRSMFAFFGWDLYGNLSTVARSQGVNVLLNIFFGVATNAAYAIAGQVQSAVGSFSNNIATAVKPQIIKSYAAGEYTSLVNLVMISSKIIFILLMLISVPLMIEMEFVLKLWLGEVPPFSVWFARLNVLFLFFSALSFVLVTAVHATGDIRRPSLINGTIYLSVLPLSYIGYKVGLSIYLPFVLNILFVVVGCVINLLTVKKYVKCVSVRFYLLHVILPCTLTMSIVTAICLSIHLIVASDWLRVIWVAVISTVASILISYLLVTNREEKRLLKDLISVKLSKWNIKKV